jgi:hypothetical protein
MASSLAVFFWTYERNDMVTNHTTSICMLCLSVENDERNGLWIRKVTSNIFNGQINYNLHPCNSLSSFRIFECSKLDSTVPLLVILPTI